MISQDFSLQIEQISSGYFQTGGHIHFIRADILKFSKKICINIIFISSKTVHYVDEVTNTLFI